MILLSSGVCRICGFPMKTTESKCKVLLLSRCLIALVLSVFMQYLLLAVFLLFINFNALHPMRWLKESSSLIFSFYTWVVITPLIASIFIYAILLGKSHLAIKRYYASRFVWLVKTFPRKLSFLGIHIVVGLLTACTYTKFLHEDYRWVIVTPFSFYFLNWILWQISYVWMLRSEMFESLLHVPHWHWHFIRVLSFLESEFKTRTRSSISQHSAGFRGAFTFSALDTI